MEIANQYFVIEGDDLEVLQNELDLYGEQGWRLHTFQSIPITGIQGVSSIKFVAILENQVFNEDDPEEETGDHGSEDNIIPMAMTGHR